MKIKVLVVEHTQLREFIADMAEQQWKEVDIRASKQEFAPEWCVMEEAMQGGVMHCLVAFDDEDKPVGYLLYVVSESLHTGNLMAIMDSIYVLPEARGKSVGRALLMKYNEQAVLQECVGLTVSLKQGVDANNLLYGFGALPSDQVYYKEL